MTGWQSQAPRTWVGYRSSRCSADASGVCLPTLQGARLADYRISCAAMHVHLLICRLHFPVCTLLRCLCHAPDGARLAALPVLAALQPLLLGNRLLLRHILTRNLSLHSQRGILSTCGAGRRNRRLDATSRTLCAVWQSMQCHRRGMPHFDPVQPVADVSCMAIMS